jgi:queuosine precursor transporter
VAFWIFKDMSFPLATALVLTAYSYKLIVALLSTPLVYLAHVGVERYLGKEKAMAMRAAALGKSDEP